MPTNIYVTVLCDSYVAIPLTVLPPEGSVDPSNYTVGATVVNSQTLDSTTTEDFLQLNDGTWFATNGTQILSVNRDVGILKNHDYVMNIPLQFQGDTTIVYVQLQLKGTETDSYCWFGSKCEPAPDGGSPQASWNSDWFEMIDSTGANPRTATTTGNPITKGDSGGWVSQWAWKTQKYGTIFSLYLCDSPGGENDDLWVMITDATNYPIHGSPHLPPGIG